MFLLIGLLVGVCVTVIHVIVVIVCASRSVLNEPRVEWHNLWGFNVLVLLVLHGVDGDIGLWLA